MSRKLGKIMVEDVVTIKQSATIKQAAELMNSHEIGCLIVSDQEKPIGILTERDILKRVVCKSRQSQKTKVREIMSRPLITASPHVHAGEAAKLMLERNIKKLPIVESERLMGLVTITDLLRSPGVIEFLNKISLDGTPTHIRKALGMYLDQAKLHRRSCPLNTKESLAMGCLGISCMWWVGDECAVAKLARLMSTEEYAETELIQEDSSPLPT